MASTISDDLRAGALVYHRSPKPGKLEIQPTKPLGNQRDLALAYSPGVAAACEAIVADPAQAAELTARAKCVDVERGSTHRSARSPARRLDRIFFVRAPSRMNADQHGPYTLATRSGAQCARPPFSVDV